VIGQTYTVPERSTGERLDRFLVEQCPNLSRAQIQRFILNGSVQLEGQAARASTRLAVHQVVTLTLPPPSPTSIVPTEIPIEIAREGPGFVIVNKPSGLVVHPAAGHAVDTLANALMARYPGLAVGNSLRPGIVHRLDKGTSGLMVVALTDAAFANLVEQMKGQRVHKEYLALVHGQVREDAGVIEAPIGRDRRNRQKMGVTAQGREARTQFRVVERLSAYTLLRLGLETGRTHQIRVHLSAIGHPIVGDFTYGGKAGPTGLTRPFLHSWYLGFENPAGGECVVVWSRLPPDLTSELEAAQSARGS
jgi:23S rRNA pseudouridine1911/1915/1917 synthase